MAELREHSLFLDETGDAGILKFNPDYPVLGICCCLIRDTDYSSTLVPAMDQLKRRWFGTTQVLLRYSSIGQKTGPFSIFRDRDAFYRFENELAGVISSLPITVFSAVIDKAAYRDRFEDAPAHPTLPTDIYWLAADFVLERCIACLEEREAKAQTFIAEGRGRKEDRLLQGHYQSLHQRGTQFYSAERFQRQLPSEILFRTKADQIAGLETADLLAPPIAQRVLHPEAPKALLWNAIEPKIWRGKSEQPGGVGLKTYPDSNGRLVLGLPLKSPRSP